MIITRAFADPRLHTEVLKGVFFLMDIGCKIRVEKQLLVFEVVLRGFCLIVELVYSAVTDPFAFSESLFDVL